MGYEKEDAEFREKSADELLAGILNWTGGTQIDAKFPARSSVLGFRDPLLERAYLQATHRQGRRYFGISLSIVCVIVVSFLWTDPWLLPAEFQPLFWRARVYVLIPSCLLLLINTLWITDPILWIRQSAALVVVFGLAHSVLLLLCGQKVFQYLELGILELILGTPLLLGMPLRWSTPVILILGAAFAAGTLYVETDYAPFVNFCVDFPIYMTLAVAASYRYEDSSRREFIAQALSRKEYSERIAIEADRRRWLEVIAAFLRHELKNSMAAISTSIELADREAPESKASKYLDRGRRSIRYMHLLLTKVADATNLESALAQHQFELLDLSELIANRISDFRSDTPGRQFSLDVEPTVRITGHGDSLIQMLDKLINNALEHGDPQSAIQIGLCERGEVCSIKVADFGDPLPTDVVEIFEPFVTRKAGRAGAANLGLGLFVARAIAINHGGSIRAEPLVDPTGACFVVDLPVTHPNPSLRDPSVAPATLGPNTIEAGVES